MVFSLEALQAFWGDCLIVHAGPAEDPRLLLIDGGPTATYATSLAPRLEQQIAAGEPTIEVRTLWHNAFDDVLGNRAQELDDAAGRGQLDGAPHDVEAVIAPVAGGRGVGGH